MPVLDTSKFDVDPIKMNVLAWRHHFPMIKIWDFLRSKAPNSKGSGPIWQNFEKFDKDPVGSKLKALAW